MEGAVVRGVNGFWMWGFDWEDGLQGKIDSEAALCGGNSITADHA
jgi:hypothetical protein